MKATFDGTWARLGADGIALYEHGGYGRPETGGLRLSPEEALYLFWRGKITIEGHTFESLLAELSKEKTFLRRYLVYRDIRERGYAIQTGPQDFRVFRRGEKPGKGRSQYMIRVLSERDIVRFLEVAGEVQAASNIRKQYLLAVVDDEGELTYYEVKTHALPEAEAPLNTEPMEGTLYGGTVIVRAPSGTALEKIWLGTSLDKEKTMFTTVEAAYLMGAGLLTITNVTITEEEYLSQARESDQELSEKMAVYRHLRDLAYIPRTGYKFGHHFRVYSGSKKHSEMLVHALAGDAAHPMSMISRSVRLAHSVRKKMLFGCVGEESIEYIEFARIKL